MANFCFKLIGEQLIRRRVGLILVAGIMLLSGCYTPVQSAAPASPAAPQATETYSPKVIPFFLWQNGSDYFTCDGQVAFGQPEALEAVKKWAALAQYAPPGFTTWGYQEQIETFLRGRVAMSMYAGRLGVNIAAKAPELEDRVTVIFPAWGPEKATLGVWSRLAIAAGTRHQAEAKAFLQWLLSGDRLLRYNMTVPGHMIPPLKSVQAMTVAHDSPYVTRHPDWLRSFNNWVVYTNHPVMNMGSIRQGRFVRSEVVPPWGSAVFGTPGIVDNMLQEITLGGRDPETAWRDAVSKLEKTVSQWKAQHPTWRPPIVS